MLNIKKFKSSVFPNLIDKIWILENGEKDTELVIPPHPYNSLIIPFHKAAYRYENTNINTPQVEGISLKSTSVLYPAHTKLVGVRFYAYGLYPFVPVNAKKIMSQTVALAPKYKLPSFYASESDAVIVEKIETMLYLLYSEERNAEIQPVEAFYKKFRWHDESASIEEFCREQNTNYTTLNRYFTKVTGLSPKKFERLVKFRKSLCALIDSDENLTSIGLDAGYFDQAHFIREFKLFVNYTPSHYQDLVKLADKDTKIIQYNFRLL